MGSMGQPSWVIRIRSTEPQKTDLMAPRMMGLMGLRSSDSMAPPKTHSTEPQNLGSMVSQNWAMVTDSMGPRSSGSTAQRSLRWTANPSLGMRWMERRNLATDSTALQNSGWMAPQNSDSMALQN